MSATVRVPAGRYNLSATVDGIRPSAEEGVVVATAFEVEEAVRLLVQRLAEVDADIRRRYSADRTVSCRVRDLDVVWSGRLCDDGLCEVTCADRDRAQVRLTVGSDDLLALAEGRLAVPAAWASGRLRVQASPLDLLRLRAVL